MTVRAENTNIAFDVAQFGDDTMAITRPFVPATSLTLPVWDQIGGEFVLRTFVVPFTETIKPLAAFVETLVPSEPVATVEVAPSALIVADAGRSLLHSRG